VVVVVDNAVITTSLSEELVVIVATDVVLVVGRRVGSETDGERVSTIMPSLIEPLTELGTTRIDVPTKTWLPIVKSDKLADDMAVVVVLTATMLPSLPAVTVAVIFPDEVAEAVAVCAILPATKVVTTTLGHKSWIPPPRRNEAISWTLFWASLEHAL